MGWSMLNLNNGVLKALIFIIISLPVLSFGQSAKFFADTSMLMEYNGHKTSSDGYGMQMQWIIKGQKLHWGSPAVEVSPTLTGVDTIYFKHKENAEWDTLLCIIAEGSTIMFEYNACCDYFDAVDASGQKFEGKVSFELKGTKPGKKKYLGSIDDSGIFMTQFADTLSPLFRSPMLPNRYNVEVEIVKKCLGKKCREVAIRKKDGSIDYGYKFRTVENIVLFHYLPVSSDPIVVSYNLETREIKIN
jgi:hypothetical protein